MTSPTAPASPATSSDPLLERLRLSTAGTYDIAGELGRGGMAVVYLAHDLKLDRRVAIKVMDPRLSLTPGMSDRFLLEARIAARLQHPNIIVVHDIRQDHELSYFVMSFVEGMAADHLCQQATPVAIDDVRWIVVGAARALAHAHAEGIVHRDIKPANILVNVKGDVILTDFGIAKALGGTSLTQSGTQVGTPSYMSPEQFTDKPVGPPSDQYSLGVTAYVLLTGRLPFSGELYQLILAHSNQVPTHVRELRPDCPAFLADAVMRMLEKDPAQRWPSLHDLADVVSESLPANGGRALAAAARLAQQERAQEVPALMALTPVSPVPAGRSPSTPPPSPPSTPAPDPPPAPVIAALQLDASSFDVEVGAPFTLPLRAFDANGTPVPTAGLDVLLDRPDAVAVDVASWLVEPRLPGDTRLIVAPRHAFASGGTPAVRASCVIRVRAVPTVVAPQAATPIAPPSPRRTMPVMLIAGGLAAAVLAFIVYRNERWHAGCHWHQRRGGRHGRSHGGAVHDVIVHHSSDGHSGQLGGGVKRRCIARRHRRPGHTIGSVLSARCRVGNAVESRNAIRIGAQHTERWRVTRCRSIHRKCFANGCPDRITEHFRRAYPARCCDRTHVGVCRTGSHTTRANSTTASHHRAHDRQRHATGQRRATPTVCRRDAPGGLGPVQRTARHQGRLGPGDRELLPRWRRSSYGDGGQCEDHRRSHHQSWTVRAAGLQARLLGRQAVGIALVTFIAERRDGQVARLWSPSARSRYPLSVRRSVYREVADPNAGRASFGEPPRGFPMPAAIFPS